MGVRIPPRLPLICSRDAIWADIESSNLSSWWFESTREYQSCRDGAIGRRGGLKIRYLASSSLAPGTSGALGKLAKPPDFQSGKHRFESDMRYQVLDHGFKSRTDRHLPSKH
jgi:hypothetical protein